MALNDINSIGINAIQNGLNSLSKNAFALAQEAARTDGSQQDKVQANQATGVQPPANESAPGTIAPTTSLGRTTELLVQQMTIEEQVKAAAAVVRTSGKVLGNFIDQIA